MTQNTAGQFRNRPHIHPACNLCLFMDADDADGPMDKKNYHTTNCADCSCTMIVCRGWPIFMTGHISANMQKSIQSPRVVGWGGWGGVMPGTRGDMKKSSPLGDRLLVVVCFFIQMHCTPYCFQKHIIILDLTCKCVWLLWYMFHSSSFPFTEIAVCLLFEV